MARFIVVSIVGEFLSRSGNSGSVLC